MSSIDDPSPHALEAPAFWSLSNRPCPPGILRRTHPHGGNRIVDVLSVLAISPFTLPLIFVLALPAMQGRAASFFGYVRMGRLGRNGIGHAERTFSMPPIREITGYGSILRSFSPRSAPC